MTLIIQDNGLQAKAHQRGFYYIFSLIIYQMTLGRLRGPTYHSGEYSRELVQITAPEQEIDMTNPAVNGLSYTEYNVPDVARTARFYEECWGLSPVAEVNGSRYFRATGAAHHIVVLHEGDTPGLRRINFSAPDREAVDGLHDRLFGLGIKIDSAPAEMTTPGGGYGFSFSDPDGLGYGITTGIAEHDDSTMEEDRPFKLSHVVLNSPDIFSQEEWFCDALGFKISDRTGYMHFIRCSMDHHSIAFAKGEGACLNHTAFEVPDFDALMIGAGRMKSKGFGVDWGVGRHGPGNNVFSYFRDPDGLVVEYTAEVEQIDDSYKVGGPEDWADKYRGPDQWGFADPPTDILRSSMHGKLVPPNPDF